jgi:pilus assembly protein Flp/PilA
MNTKLNAAEETKKSPLPRRLLRDQRGAGLVEYAMLAGLVAIAAFGAFRAFGGNVSTAVTNQGTTVSGIPTAE